MPGQMEGKMRNLTLISFCALIVSCWLSVVVNIKLAHKLREQIKLTETWHDVARAQEADLDTLNRRLQNLLLAMSLHDTSTNRQ